MPGDSAAGSTDHPRVVAFEVSPGAERWSAVARLRRLVGQTVVVRANDEAVAAYLGPKQVALHRRCWGIGEDIELGAYQLAAVGIGSWPS